MSSSSLRVAVSGASGLIGRSLVQSLIADGHRVFPLVRRVDLALGDAILLSATDDESIVDAKKLEGMDAVVHLAGEPIAARRWNHDVKQSILASRVRTTKLLAETLASLQRKPRVFVSASAIGFYGNRPGDDVLDERSPPPAEGGFMTDVVQAWESAADVARHAGIRVVHPRTGIVLTARDGALGQMLLPFWLGVGGVIGSGKQFMSWISLHDEVRALRHLIETSQLEGAVNLTAPHAVSNARFTEALGGALNRLTLLPMPEFAVRIAFGEMGERLLLEGAKVYPRRLLDDGFKFEHDNIDDAMKWAVADR